MNILKIKNKYVAVVSFMMLAVTLQAQDYGALRNLKATNSMNIFFSLLE